VQLEAHKLCKYYLNICDADSFPYFWPVQYDIPTRWVQTAVPSSIPVSYILTCIILVLWHRCTVKGVCDLKLIHYSLCTCICWKVTVKLPLYTPWKLTGGVEVFLHSCLLTALDGDEWSAFCRCCFVLVAVECEPEWAPEQVGTVSWRGKFSVTGNRIELLFFEHVTAVLDHHEHVECTVEVTWVLHSLRLTVRGILNASLFSITCCILCWSLLKSDLRNVHIYSVLLNLFDAFLLTREKRLLASTCMSVRSSVGMYQLGSHWTVCMKCDIGDVCETRRENPGFGKSGREYRALDVNTWVRIVIAGDIKSAIKALFTVICRKNAKGTHCHRKVYFITRMLCSGGNTSLVAQSTN
jgi:hypothetical protein